MYSYHLTIHTYIKQDLRIDPRASKTMMQGGYFQNDPDVVIYLADEQTRRVHGCILALASSVLQALLRQPSNDDEETHLHLPDISVEQWDTFYSFLDCSFASCRTAIITAENVHMLSNLFNMFQMDNMLKVLCFSFSNIECVCSSRLKCML
jgi:Trk-type K+ transport system membrane component